MHGLRLITFESGAHAKGLPGDGDKWGDVGECLRTSVTRGTPLLSYWVAREAVNVLASAKSR